MERAGSAAAVAEPYGLLIGGAWVRRPRSIEVSNPFDGRRVAAVTAAEPEDVQAAIGAAEAALAVDFPLHARLRRVDGRRRPHRSGP